MQRNQELLLKASLTEAEVLEILGIDKAQLKALNRSGDIPRFKFSKGDEYFPSSIMLYLEKIKK